MNETIFLGGCPVIRPEGIYLDGHRVIRLGLQGTGLGDPGDLLAYRQEWEPFIGAHLALWRSVRDLLESVPDAKKCPEGIFDVSQIKNLDPTTISFCASLSLARMYTSATHPLGIQTQWNAWKDKSSAEILAGAPAMLQWHQDVVMRVGNSYKDELVKIAGLWKIAIELPDLPSFTLQQEIRARIEGAYISVKGVVQIIGYGLGEALKGVGSVAQAVGDGLSETARQLPKTTRWIGIAAAVTAVVVGGVLIVYYHPRAAKQLPVRA